jgi:hypothetical protein
MKRMSFALAAVAMLAALPLQAQNNAGPSTSDKPAAADTVKKAAETRKAFAFAPQIEIQHLRANDQRGINVFETPKQDKVPYTGFRLNFGAAFTQQFTLDHSNTATPKVVNNVDANELMEIGHGFNNAVANLYMNAQLAPGIRVALTTYLSSRHHQETWVKDGYLLIDDSPFDVAALKSIMKYVTVRAGHFEVNYGDAHFRRTDNGNATYNPFVGNLVLDAFTTEVGAELYVRSPNGLMAMGAVTGGEIKGNVLTPDDRAPAFIAKLGFDRQLNDDVRVRLTGSRYSNSKSPGGTLYAGDRSGSRYYFVLENTAATANAQFSSGLLNPQFRRSVTAYQINPFIKVQGLELFGVIEQAKGVNSATETTKRTWNQYAGEAVYRFLPGEKMYVAGRYNTAKGDLVGMTTEVGVNRTQIGGGWFLTPNVLLKGEWVNQKYNDFPTADIRNGGKFKGFIMEGVVAF